MKGQRGGPVQLKPDDIEYSTSKSPEMARIGGGMNAKVGVAIFAVVLAAVVWVAISGRPQAGPAALLTAAGAAADLPSTAALTPEPSPSPSPAPLPPLDSFGVILNLGDVGYMTTLDHLFGNLSAVVRVPIPLQRDSGTLEFNQIWTHNGSQRTQMIGLWRIPLTALDDPKRDSTVLIDKEVAPRTKLIGAPSPLQRGYHIKVSGVNGLLFGLLSVEITLGPDMLVDGPGDNP
jgi:hypothetical protein